MYSYSISASNIISVTDGKNYNVVISLNPSTGQPFTSSSDAITYATNFVNNLNNYLLTNEKNQQISIINSAFNQTLNQGFTSPTLNFTVSTDSTNLQNLHMLYTYMSVGNVASVQIKTSNGVVTITLSQLTTLITELGEYLQSLYQQLWSIESQINSATSMSQIKSINWTMPVSTLSTSASASGNA